MLHQAVGTDDIRSALQTILASETFSRSQQLSRLLKYLCNCLIEHGADRIAEYAIGTEVLGRPKDFDPSQDAAVRVEMHRLRRRLRDYYESEGSRDTVRVVIPPGRYAPVVMWADEQTEPAGLSPVLDAPTASPAESIPEDAPLVSAKTGDRHYGLLFTAGGVGVMVVVLLLSTMWRRSTDPSTATHGEISRAIPSMTLPAPLLGFRIGCGRRRPWTDRLGQVWSRDEYFEGGNLAEFPPRSYIARASDARLYEAARTGSFSYKIPLPGRTYEMRLYFIEPTFGPETDAGGEGNRMFSVAVNGTTVLDRFDILADADGSWVADVRVFKDIAPAADGYVHLDLKGINGEALLNAIELVPARPHILNPIRMLPQDNFYTDSAGNLWTPDNYSRGGRTGLHPGPIRNTHDQEIFRHERFGHFQYAIPVDKGSYSLYLYLAEEYWGPGNTGGGGIGTRVFDVYCNGTALMRGLDLFKEVGTNYGVVKAFHHLTPNSQGKLVISFEPVHDYASFYALEVIDETGPDSSSSGRIVNNPTPAS